MNFSRWFRDLSPSVFLSLSVFQAALLEYEWQALPLFLPSVDKERTEELLQAIQRKTVTLDTLRYNPLPVSSSPPAPADGEIDSAEPPQRHTQAVK